MAIGAALALAVPSAAAERGAAVGGVADLSYRRGGGDDPVHNAFTVGLRVRGAAGSRRVGACFGLDARAGAGGGGAVYGAALYPVGVSVRYAGTSQIALCGGAAVAGVSGGAVPLAWTVPVELAWEGTGAFGIMRPLIAVRAARVVGGAGDASAVRLLGAEHEIHGTAGVRIVLPAKPVGGIATADGLFVGITYDRSLAGTSVGVALGYAVAAHR